MDKYRKKYAASEKGKATRKKWIEKNRAKIRKQQKEYQLRNAEKWRQYHNEWQRKPENRKKKKEWTEKNRAKVRKQQKEYIHRDIEKWKQWHREWTIKNPSKIIEYRKRWWKRIENRKKVSKNHQIKREEQRKELLEIAGKSKCARCGFNDWRALQIDHINGGGVKEFKTGVMSYLPHYKKKILENPKEYQVLCANCNWIKRYEKNETTLKY